jgi:hypothetical protein
MNRRCLGMAPCNERTITMMRCVFSLLATGGYSSDLGLVVCPLSLCVAAVNWHWLVSYVVAATA